MRPYLLGLVFRLKSNPLELEVKDLTDLSIIEVFKHERRFQWEPPRKAGIDISKHVFHLVLVTQQQHTSVFACGALNFGNDGIDDCSFERVTAVGTASFSKHVSLIDDENFTNSRGQNGFCVGF